jgi:hypothetical protein
MFVDVLLIVDFVVGIVVTFDCDLLLLMKIGIYDVDDVLLL